MQKFFSGFVDLTIVAFFHREGGFCVPLLNQLVEISHAIFEEKIKCTIVLNLDAADEATELIIKDFAKVNNFIINKTNVKNAGAARDLVIDKINSTYTMFLDGDDLISLNWPLDALNFANSDVDNDRTIYHPEYFVSFNSTDVDTELFINQQLTTGEYSFHTLMLGTRWYFCNNIFCNTNILKQNRFPKYDHSTGVGSEDWEWSINTTLKGIKRCAIPETVYFYRRKHQHESVGSQPGLLLRNNPIYNDAELANEYLLKYSLDIDSLKKDSSVSLTDDTKRRSLLLRNAVNVAKYDLSLYGLIKEIPFLPLVKQESTYSSTFILANLILFLKNKINAVLIFSDRTYEDELEKIENLTGNRPYVFISNSSHLKPIFIDNSVIVISLPQLREKINEHHFKEMILNVCKNNKFSEFINLDSEFFDDWIFDYRKPMRFAGICISRLIPHTIIDLDDGRFERKKITKILSGNIPYTKLIPETSDVFLYLNNLGLNNFFDIREFSLNSQELLTLKNNNILSLENKFDEKINISLLITFHNEGYQAILNLISLVSAINYCSDNGVSVELLINLNKVDRLTYDILNKFVKSNSDCNVKLFEFGNESNNTIGFIRNCLINVAKGQLIFLCDGDDGFSANWLLDCWRLYLTQKNEKSFYLPEYYLNFHNSPNQVNIDTHYIKTPAYSKDTLIAECAFNQWTSIFAASKEFFLINKFEVHDGIVYEDWILFNNALLRGFVPAIIPNTMTYVRLKSDGLNSRHKKEDILIDTKVLLEFALITKSK